MAAMETALTFATQLRRALAGFRARADRLRAEDEFIRLPERTLADLGLRRIDLAAQETRQAAVREVSRFD